MKHDKNEEKFFWWQKGIIYQVYPRSFMDSNGDGVGDLKGIASKLDYLKWLGVDAIWISPIYPSPMEDFGYDISNYKGIHPLFGTMDEFEELLHQTHLKGIKLILDLVPNHTSDQHPWFLESRSSRTNSKRDWYLWKDPAQDGGPPNNWLSVFGGSAWEWDDKTGQYYYHAYLKDQPDLNWRNHEVQEAMYDVMRFWLDKGIDGFRVDVMWHMIKDDQWRNNPKNPNYTTDMAPYYQLEPAYSVHQPMIHEIVEKMRNVLDEYAEKVMIGEIYLSVSKLVTYYGIEGKGVHLPFNFQLITLPWDAREISRAIDHYEAVLPLHGWPNWVLSNHDKPRIATRAGIQQAKVAAILLLTLRGTPTLYYGDELGMENGDIPSEKVQDPWEKNVPGKGVGRDPVRTPMQWDDSPNAGFTQGEAWLPIQENFPQLNVKKEMENGDSVLMLYHRLIQFRRKEDALTIGNYIPVPSDGNLLAYIREHNGKRFMIVLNFGNNPNKLESKNVNGISGSTIVLGTNVQKEGFMVDSTIYLEGNEGIIIELQ